MTSSARPIITPGAPGGRTLRTGPSEAAAQDFKAAHAKFADKLEGEAEPGHEDPQAGRSRAGGSRRASPDSVGSDRELSPKDSLAMMGLPHTAGGAEAFEMRRLPPPPPPAAPPLPEPAKPTEEGPKTWVVFSPKHQFHPALRVVPGSTEPGLARSAIIYAGLRAVRTMNKIKDFLVTADNLPKESFQVQDEGTKKIEQRHTFSDFLHMATDGGKKKIIIDFAWKKGEPKGLWLSRTRTATINLEEAYDDEINGVNLVEVLNAASAEAWSAAEKEAENGLIAREAFKTKEHVQSDCGSLLSPGRSDGQHVYTPGRTLYGMTQETTEGYNSFNHRDIIDAMRRSGHEVGPYDDRYRNREIDIKNEYEHQKASNHTNRYEKWYEYTFYSIPRIGAQDAAKPENLKKAIELVSSGEWKGMIGPAARLTEGILNDEGRINAADLEALQRAAGSHP